jgi:hypothetical protein
VTRSLEGRCVHAAVCAGNVVDKLIIEQNTELMVAISGRWPTRNSFCPVYSVGNISFPTILKGKRKIEALAEQLVGQGCPRRVGRETIRKGTGWFIFNSKEESRFGYGETDSGQIGTTTRHTESSIARIECCVATKLQGITTGR